MQFTQQGLLNSFADRGTVTIVTVVNPQSISVLNGTAFGSVPFPATVRALNSNGFYADYPATFVIGSYDSSTNGSYTINGTLNDYGNAVSVVVWVLPSPVQWFDLIDYSLMGHTIDNLGRIVTSATAKVGNSIAQGSASLANRPSWNGDGIYYNTQGALSWGTTSSHNTFHQDTPWTVFIVWKQLTIANTRLEPLLCSNAITSANTGIFVGVDNRSASSHTNAINVQITKGSAGNTPISVITGNNVITQNAWNWLKMKFDGTDFTLVVNGSTVGTQTPVISFATGNASAALMVGNNSTVGTQTGVNAYIKHVYMEDSFVSGATETLLDSWAVAMSSEGLAVEPENVYLLYGQSNMAGRGLNSAISGDLTGLVGAKIMQVLPTPPTSTSGVGTINSQSYWEELELARNQTFESVATLHGMEMRFGKNLHAYNKSCWILKLGVGGTPIVSTASFNDWNIATAQLYTHSNNLISTGLLEMVHIFRKAPILRGLVWMQGETDAIITGAGSVYKTNLTNFINGTIDTAVAAGYTVDKLRIYIFRITDVGGFAYDPTEFAAIYAAQSDIGANYLTDNPSRTSNVKGTTWRTTDDATMGDTQHYDAAFLDTMGQEIFHYFKIYAVE